jgi:uncharacterized membrane protein YphA (DoxX/SURF4 family)
MALQEWVNFIGRALVAGYFLWAAWFNIKTWQFNIAEFRRIGLPGGTVLLPIGILVQVAGSVLFLNRDTILAGASFLLGFTWLADMLFHRFWTYKQEQERTMHQQFLFEHAALAGGIIGLSVPAL